MYSRMYSTLNLNLSILNTSIQIPRTLNYINMTEIANCKLQIANCVNCVVASQKISPYII